MAGWSRARVGGHAGPGSAENTRASEGAGRSQPPSCSSSRWRVSRFATGEGAQIRFLLPSSRAGTPLGPRASCEAAIDSDWYLGEPPPLKALVELRGRPAVSLLVRGSGRPGAPLSWPGRTGPRRATTSTPGNRLLAAAGRAVSGTARSARFSQQARHRSLLYRLLQRPPFVGTVRDDLRRQPGRRAGARASGDHAHLKTSSLSVLGESGRSARDWPCAAGYGPVSSRTMARSVSPSG